MKTLFTRVLLVLLGSFLVVALVSGLVIKWISHELDPQDDRFQKLAADVASDVVEKYESGEFQKFRRQVNKRFNTRIWLHDLDKNIWEPRPAPRDLMTQITDYPQVIMPYQNTAGRFFVFTQSIRGSKGEYQVIMTSRRPVFPHHSRPRKTILPIAIMVIGLCVGSALLSYWVLFPIREIRRTSRQISGENLKPRVPKKIVERKDAFGDLGREINSMADRVEAVVDNQNQLLRDVSHELRSPLARIQVATGLLEQKQGESPEVSRISEEVSRLNGMIEDLISLSRIKNLGEVAMEQVNLGQLLRDVADNANFEFQSSNATVKVNLNAEPTLSGHPDLLQSLFENIIRNALRFSPSGSVVGVDVSVSGEQCTTRVTDHGPGVPAEELDRIFDPFFRSDKSREVGDGNHGIGLALASSIAQLHGGTISAENRSEGGLEVSVYLPLG